MNEQQIRQAIAQCLQANPISLHCAYEIVNVIEPSLTGHPTTVGVHLYGNPPNDFDDLSYRAGIENQVQQSHDLDVILTPVS